MEILNYIFRPWEWSWLNWVTLQLIGAIGISVLFLVVGAYGAIGRFDKSTLAKCPVWVILLLLFMSYVAACGAWDIYTTGVLK